MVFFFNFPILPDMRKDVQQIFKSTPHDKQVMMFSATLSKEIRPVCKKFMQDVKSCDLSFAYFGLIVFLVCSLRSTVVQESWHIFLA